MCVSTGLLRSMGIILRTQKMAAGHAAAAFHKHCIKLHYGWLERRLTPSSFSLERRGRSQRIVLDPGIHVQRAQLHNPAQITLVSSAGNARIVFNAKIVSCQYAMLAATASVCKASGM